jgi:hypothetical protein
MLVEAGGTYSYHWTWEGLTAVGVNKMYLNGGQQLKLNCTFDLNAQF